MSPWSNQSDRCPESASRMACPENCPVCIALRPVCPSQRSSAPPTATYGAKWLSEWQLCRAQAMNSDKRLTP
eukprot:6269640-Amphidinium_carterae.1